jgi:hypothetical protein
MGVSWRRTSAILGLSIPQRRTRAPTDHSWFSNSSNRASVGCEARRANRNIVTRAVGIEMDVECDLTEVDAPTATCFAVQRRPTDMIDDATIARLRGTCGGRN